MTSRTHLSFRSCDPSIATRWNCQTSNGRPIASAKTGDPLATFDAIETDMRREASEGRSARYAGFVGYELNRSIESLPPQRPASAGLPTLALWRVDDGSNEDTKPLEAGAATVVARSMSREAYLTKVRRAIDYVAAGDVFQVNLAQTFAVRTSLAASHVWRHLRHHSPARFDAFVDLGDVAIVSNSPELFFRVEPPASGRRRITTRPIKGTRPRGPGMRDALERSEKDRAELAMIVDLSRNDLGRICKIGSVRVVEPRVIEEHPTLYHGVATIEGFLRPDVTLADVFRAMFPCGSITGCPKVRAMQIIDELETEPRGPYCGAIGYVDGDGSAEFSVAIRTMTMRDGVARVSVGGGIVADSDPVEEHRETIVKARAMLRALGVSDADIDALDS